MGLGDGGVVAVVLQEAGTVVPLLMNTGGSDASLLPSDYFLGVVGDLCRDWFLPLQIRLPENGTSSREKALGVSDCDLRRGPAHLFLSSC